MQKVLFLTFIFNFSVCFSQSNDLMITNYNSFQDTVDYDYYDTKWFTVGAQYELINSTFGLLISNGYDERPLIHFEDFSEEMIYKVSGQTDFKKDYFFNTIISWKYPCRYLVLTTLEFSQKNYSSRQFFYRDINISATAFLKPLQCELFTKIGFQTLEENNNFGASLGLQKVLFYQRLYSGCSIGYYFDYFNYSLYLHSFIIKHKIGIRLAYDRIESNDFINLGLNFTFIR